MRIGKRSGMAAMLIIAMASCASLPAPLAPDAYRLEIRDNPSEHRFDVVLQSQHDRALCVNPDDWPNSKGMLFVENPQVYLDTSSARLPLKSSFSSVYCPGGCGYVRVEPRGKLSSFFAYSAFDDADRIASETSRRLHFFVSPTLCH